MFAFVVAALCFAFVLRQDVGFFYTDDVEHELMPLIRALAPDLGLFSWPSLTLRSWSAGYLGAEQVLGLGGPLNRVLYGWMGSIDDFRVAAAIYALTHLAILFWGTHLAARAYGASSAAAAVAAFALATNNLVVYWYAASWWNVLASLSWLPWVLWARSAPAPAWTRFILIVLSSYLVITAAGTHAVVACAIFLGLHDLHDLLGWRSPDPRRLDALPLGVPALAASLLIAAPTWMPLLNYLPDTVRLAWVEPADSWSALFGDLLQVTNPFFRPKLEVFDATARIGVPGYYLAWFSVVLLVLAPADRWRALRRRHGALLIGAVIFFVASQGPSMIGPLRFAFRFMPFWFLCVILIVALLGDRECDEQRDRGRRFVALGLGAYALLYAWQRGDPNEFTLERTGPWIAATLALIFRRSLSPGNTWAFCLLVSAFFFVQTHVLWWRNANLTHWDAPVRASAIEPAPDEVRRLGANTVYVVPRAWSRGETFHEELSTGNVGLHSGRNLVFGYTPTGHRRLNERFCLFFLGWACHGALGRVMERDPVLDASVADLMRVTEIIAMLPVSPKDVKDLERSGWVREDGFDRKVSARWVRVHPIERPGTVSFARPDVSISLEGRATAEAEDLVVANSGEAMSLVFARLFLPGYQVTLDDRPLSTYAHDDLVLGVRLPANTAGHLALRFVEPTRTASWWMVLGGASMLVGISSWLFRRARRKPMPV